MITHAARTTELAPEQEEPQDVGPAAVAADPMMSLASVPALSTPKKTAEDGDEDQATA